MSKLWSLSFMVSEAHELSPLEFKDFIWLLTVAAAYLLTMYHLPNRAFYEQMASMDYMQLQKTLFNLFLYSGLQLASLLILNGQNALLGVSTIGFRTREAVQPRPESIDLWVFYNVQSSLQHCGKSCIYIINSDVKALIGFVWYTGFDYSFKFSWLKAHPSLPP